VPDSLVRVQLQATGADQILATLRAVRQEVALLGQQSARINLAANTTTVNQQLGGISTQLTRINQTTARARVDVDTSQAENRLAGLESKVSSIMTGSLAAIGAIIGVQITKGIGAAADAIVGFNSTLEQTRVAFTSLFGSASRANDFLGQLQDFAKKTPFDFDQVNRYAQRLLAVGFAAKDVIPDLTAMGNAVAAAGGNSETLDRVTLALGQMHNSIKLNSQDMNQLIQANIPAWKLLADQLGVTEAKARQMAETGKISGAAASTAIIAGMSQLPNLMDQISKTFAGKLENLNDTFRQEMAGIGQPLFEELSKAVDLGAEALASPKFKQAATDLVDDLTAITKAAEAVAAALGKIPTGAIPYLEAALSPGHALIGAVKSLGKINVPGIDTGPAADQSAAGDFAPTVSGAGFLQQRAASGAIADLTNQVRTGALTADQARQQWRALSDTFGGLYGNAADLSHLFSGELNQAIEDHITQVNAATAAHEKLQDALKQAGQAQALGASSEDVGRAIFGITGTGAQATPEQIQRAKQDIQDLTTAYQRAAQVIGTVDLAHGIAGFAAVAPDLAKARDSLRDLGQSNQALDNLASLSAQFKRLTDATDAATTAYKGFMLTLTETDQKIQQLTTFRGQVTGAASDADRRRSLGIATPEDLQLLANYKNILANIDQQKTGLQRNATGDILGIAANYPDLKKADDTLRDMIGKVGGPQQLVIDVKTNTDKALEQITDLLAKPHQATIDVQIATHLTGLPPALATIIANAAGAQIGGAQPGGGTVGDSGYARPTTIRSTGGGPYGNDSLQQGGAGGGGGWNQFQPLSQSQYGSIVTSGPLANPQAYAAIIAAAQEKNVDPRALLAFMKFENSYATNISGSQLAGNNLAGIKYAGQPGASSGVTSPEGDPYAKFASLTDFFRAMATNLTTGQYAGDYQSGNLTAVRQRYVAGSATPSTSQAANIANTVSYYGDLSQQYPAASGTHDAVASTVRDQIVQKALADVDQDKLAGYCEQWVEETVQAITGKRGATGKNELSANAAFASAQKQGLVTTDPQPGDLVYYGDATNGHVAIYMGGGKQVSTADVGGSRIHTEAVGAGAQYVSIGAAGGASGLSPELAAALGIHSGAQSYLAAAGGGTTNLTGTAAAGDAIAAASQLAASTAAITTQTAGIKSLFAAMDPKDVQAATQAFQNLQPVLDAIAQKKAAIQFGPDILPSEQAAASSAALQQGLGFLDAWSHALSDIRSQTGNLAADEQRITDIIGGPLAANLNQQLDVMSSQAQIASQITQLTDRKKTLEADHAAIVAQRQQTDQAASRAQTMQGWADQAADSQRQHDRRMAQQDIQARTTAENQGYTDTTRGIEDQGTAADRSHTIASRQFEDQLNAITKAQQTNSAGNTIASEVFAAQAGGPGTLASKRLAAENLLIQKEYEARAKDTLTSQLDGIKTAQIAETRRYEDAKYHIQQEGVDAARVHEDRVAALQRESQIMQDANAAQDEQIQATRTARDQAYQIQQWQIEDQRAREDAAYQAATKAIDDEIAKQQELATTADAALASLQSAATLLGQTGDQLSQTLGAAVTSAQSASSGFLQSQPVGGGSIKRLAAGGAIPAGGSALVGDAPGGGMTPFTELVFAPGGAVVTPLHNRVVSAGDGGSITVNAPITVNADPNVDATIRSILAPIEAQLRAALTPTRTGGSGRKAG
jgi:tape measure domain-containing protein